MTMSPREEKVGVDLGLSPEEKSVLRHIARYTVENAAQGKTVAPSPSDSAKLNERYGAFVTLYKKGMLRGCIGTLESDKPLYQTVSDMAKAAALRDPRFRPVTPDELPYIDLEISVLTPLEEIASPDEIKVGVHGLLISKGSRSGLLLPQVASERNWDTITFLEETCRKAGLPKDAWKEEGTRIYVFSADVF
ncbi:MAG: AmmeMemoRadiSam system protein A [Desulfomonilaceae bacterium]